MSTSSSSFVLPAVALNGPPLRAGSKPKPKRKGKRYLFSTPKKAKLNKAIAKAKAQEKAQAPPAAAAPAPPAAFVHPRWNDQNPPPPPPSPPPQQQDDDQPQGSALFYDEELSSEPAYDGPVPSLHQDLHGHGGVLNTDVDMHDMGQPMHDDYAGLPRIEDYEF
jgi:hypothetical protein